MSKKLLSILSVMVSVMLFAISANSATINIYQIGNTENLNDSGGNPIPTDSLIQVLVSPDMVIDSINLPSITPSDDDYLAGSFYATDPGGIYLFASFTGEYILDIPDAYITAVGGVTNVPLYIRFFSVEDPSTAYDNGDPFSYGTYGFVYLAESPNIGEYDLFFLDQPGDTPVDAEYPVNQGNGPAVPEPFTIITLLAGITGIKFWSRKK